MTNRSADNPSEGQAAEGVSRREVLVMLGGATLGTFALPALADVATSGGAGGSSLASRKIVLAPTRQSLGGDNFLLVWNEETESGVHAMVWHPETASEKRDAQAFYEAARDYEPDSLLRRAADWLGEKLAGRKRSPQEKSLQQGILDAPDDLAAVLRYADWLTEQGNPQGEFIRIDCDMEGMKGSDPRHKQLSKRWSELYEQIGKPLVKPLAKLGIKPMISGQLVPYLFLKHGLVVSVEIEKPSVLPRRFKQLLDAAPLLRSISLGGDGIDVVGIAACPELSQIETLEVKKCELSDDGMAALTRSPHLTKLKHLSLNYNPLSFEAIQVLASSPLLGQLKSLELNGCDLGHEGLDALCKSTLTKGLEKLHLSNNDLSEEHFISLSESQHLSSLKDLNLASNKMTDVAMKFLCSAAFFPQLEVLDLNSCDLAAVSLRPLQPVRGTRLRVWNLSSNKFGEAGFQALASLPLLATVENLSFDWCNMTDDNVKVILHSPHLGELKSLSLNYSDALTDRAAEAIAASSKLNKLEELLLGDSRIGAAGVTALARSPGLPSLERLELHDVPIGAEGALALANSPHLSRLVNLVVTEAEVTEQGKQALEKRFGDDVSCW